MVGSSSVVYEKTNDFGLSMSYVKMGLKLGSKSMFGRCGVVYEKTNDGTNTFGRRRDKGDCGMYHHATADRLPATHVLYHHKKKF